MQAMMDRHHKHLGKTILHSFLETWAFCLGKKKIMIIVFETELNQLMHNFMFHLNSIFNFAGLQRKLSTSRAKMEYFGASNPPIEN